MRNTILTVLLVPLLAALTAQTAMASEHHRTRTTRPTVAIEQFRNSNAFALPGNIAARVISNGQARANAASKTWPGDLSLD